jgi:hypothetical protein
MIDGAGGDVVSGKKARSMEDTLHDGPVPFDVDLLHKLDACRPGHEDAAELLSESDRRVVAADPRYAERQRRTAAFDAAVARVYADVPVPVGVAERLQAALAAAADVESPIVADSPAPPLPSRFHRRRWLAAAGSALTATAAGWALFAWWRGRERDAYTTEELLHAALVRLRQTDAERNVAVPESKQAPPREFPRSAHVVPEAEPRWRRLEEPLVERAGVAYELAPANAPRAVLYVLATRGEHGAPDLPPLPTDVPHTPSSTGGCALGAWREDDRLCVLVVDGDERRYRGFVERPQVVA